MSGESYTRWRSTSSDDDDDDGEKGGPGDGGESSVTIITQPRPPAPSLDSPAAQTRVICVMILGCLVCLVVGVWVGREWGRVTAHFPVHLVVPAPQEDHTHAHRLLYNLKPTHIEDFMRKLSQISQNSQKSYIEKVWKGLGMDTSTTTFTVDIPRPDTERPSTVEVTYSDGDSEVLTLPPTSPDTATPIPTSSEAGVAEGVVVYGHYGRREDLATLQTLKVCGRGAILVVRQGKLHPGAKVHNAKQAGAIGLILYPDPKDFRGGRKGGAPYPGGMGLPDDGIVWESLRTVPGDPATPSLPSLQHVYRENGEVPPASRLPVLSVSSEVASRLLEMVGGPDVPEGWVGALPLHYRLGGSWRPAANVTNITLTVNNILNRETITNIHATMPATDETKVVMVGSHYGSPHASARAGLAALLALSSAMATSYLPQGTARKIVFSAWAATEQGMIGSTEFSQLHSWWVDSSLLAYLSLDEVTRGTGSLKVLASSVLRQAIREAAKQVPWPEGKGISVRDGWRLSDPPGENDVHFSNLGSGSDFVSFAAQRGVPSAHFMVMGKGREAEYSLRHSQYDTLDAFTKHLDPGLSWTHTITCLVGSVSLVLTQSQVPPLVLSEVSGDLYNTWHQFLHLHSASLSSADYNFTGILDAIENEILRLQERLSLLNNWYHSRPYTLRPLVATRPRPQHQSSEVERRVWWASNLERGLLGPRGVARAFTTHLMVGPDPENPYSVLHFPHVARAITRALQHHTPWATVHLELSYVLAAIASYRTIFPSDVPPEPHYTL